MSGLEPPEVPIELSKGLQEPIAKEKKGFFSKLFSKNSDIDTNMPVISNIESSSDMNMPSLDLQSSDNNLNSIPELPPLDEENFSNLSSNNSKNQLSGIMVASSKSSSKSSKTKVKSSNKKSKIESKNSSKVNESSKHSRSKHNVPLPRIDESSQFDWTRDINDQEILIHDSNRFNSDIDGSDSISSGASNNDSQDLFPKLEPITLNLKKLDSLSGSNNYSNSASNSDDNLINTANNTMPIADKEHKELFQKISSNHGKLRKKLSKVVNSKNPKKEEIKNLLNDYDESVEKHIEDKELELNSKKKHLDKFEKHLKNKEDALTVAHDNVKEVHNQLKSREEEINDVISETVDSELDRRLKDEKIQLRTEIKKNQKLNSELEKKSNLLDAELKKKSKMLDDARSKLIRDQERIIESERKKLNELQAVYETKLSQLDFERKRLESEKKDIALKKSEALALIKQANVASRELSHIDNVKGYIDKNRQRVEKEIDEDKQLKMALEKAEKSLIEERKNLDNLIFSKYIENKLKSIKPENLNNSQDWNAELNSNPLYSKINECRNLLQSKKLNEAKSVYNNIRQSYDNLAVSRTEKEALYVALRELYNDIQIKMVESQMHIK